MPHTPHSPQRQNSHQNPRHSKRPAGGVEPRSAAANPRLLFGAHAVSAAWVNPNRLCHRLMLTKGASETLKPALEAARESGLKRPEPQIVEREAIDRLLPDAVHQGICLDAAPLPEVDLEALLAKYEGSACLVALDQVTDPHNVGAVMRSAAAFGAAGVIVPRHHAPDITGTLAKISSGAVEHVPLLRVGNLVRALEQAMDARFITIGMEEHAGQMLAAYGGERRVVLVLGAEGEGLRRLTRETCQFKAKLPTGGPVGSLNVSNAAAIALYEWARGGSA